MAGLANVAALLASVKGSQDDRAVRESEIALRKAQALELTQRASLTTAQIPGVTATGKVAGAEADLRLELLARPEFRAASASAQLAALNLIENENKTVEEALAQAKIVTGQLSEQLTGQRKEVASRTGLNVANTGLLTDQAAAVRQETRERGDTFDIRRATLQSQASLAALDVDLGTKDLEFQGPERQAALAYMRARTSKLFSDFEVEATRLGIEQARVGQADESLTIQREALAENIRSNKANEAYQRTAVAEGGRQFDSELASRDAIQAYNVSRTKALDALEMMKADRTGMLVIWEKMQEARASGDIETYTAMQNLLSDQVGKETGTPGKMMAIQQAELESMFRTMASIDGESMADVVNRFDGSLSAVYEDAEYDEVERAFLSIVTYLSTTGKERALDPSGYGAISMAWNLDAAAQLWIQMSAKDSVKAFALTRTARSSRQSIAEMAGFGRELSALYSPSLVDQTAQATQAVADSAGRGRVSSALTGARAGLGGADPDPPAGPIPSEGGEPLEEASALGTGPLAGAANRAIVEAAAAPTPGVTGPGEEASASTQERPIRASLEGIRAEHGTILAGNTVLMAAVDVAAKRIGPVGSTGTGPFFVSSEDPENIQHILSAAFEEAAKESDGSFGPAEVGFMWAIDRPLTDPAVRNFFSAMRADLGADLSKEMFLPMLPSEAALLDHPWLASNSEFLAELDVIDNEFKEIYRPITAESVENRKATLDLVANLAKFHYDNLQIDLSRRARGKRGIALAGALGIPSLLWGKKGDRADIGMMKHFSPFVIRRLKEIRKTPEGKAMFQRVEIEVAEHAARSAKGR